MDEMPTETTEALEITDDGMAALEAQVGAAMKEMSDEAFEDLEEVGDVGESDSAEESDETEEVDDGTEESDEIENSGVETEDAEESEVDDGTEKSGTSPVLPVAYRRSLLALDWTDDEINAAVSAGGAGFVATAQKLHATRNAEVAKWAEAGRKAREATENPEVPVDKTIRPFDSSTGQFTPIDTEALIETHGNEDLVRSIVDPVNQVLADLNTVLPDLMTGVHAIHQSRQDTLGRQIDEFFGGEELKPFTELYGAEDLNEDHFKQRNSVLEMADALIAGAAQQGRNLTVKEALTLAHDSNSGDFKIEAARGTLRKQVKKRAKAVTLKPRGAVSKTSGPPKNMAELEARTRDRLAEVFGN